MYCPTSRDFLRRCEEYNLQKRNEDTTIAVVENLSENDKIAELTRMAQQRNSKMEQYRQKKELDDEIKKIKILLTRDHIEDDSVKRDFYVKLIKSSLMESQDELRSINQEAQILNHIATMRHDNPDFDKLPPPSKRPSQPLKPIIITKDAVQKAVYGAGYPSLPTMSVDDFYEDRVREGIFPDPTVLRDPNSLQARAMRGEATELDEQEEVKKVYFKIYRTKFFIKYFFLRNWMKKMMMKSI